jgi:RNA polymerase sigma factor (sigma-70 family)
MEDDDLALLARWRANDKAAGNLLFKRYFSALYRFFENKINGDVDDLVQRTLLECVKSQSTFRRQSSFRTYLFAIARNVLYGHWRAQAATQPTLDFEEVSIASLSTSLGSQLAARQDLGRVLSALRTLPLDQQLLFEMSFWKDFSREQLAEVFEVEPATIGTRLFRAKQALREALDRDRPGAAHTSEAQLAAWVEELSDDALLEDPRPPAVPGSKP